MAKSKRNQSLSNGSAKRLPAAKQPSKPALNEDDCNGMPARMVYSPSGIIPATITSPDHEPPVLVKVTVNLARGSRIATRTTNGLTARADVMARWAAHGASTSDAYRVAYSPAPTVSPVAITHRAHMIARLGQWRDALTMYREQLAEKRAQSLVSMADYVKGRLVLESQAATNDGARIQSLKLLGMTEGLFTSVQRVERTISPHDLQSLKAKLDQRVRDVLARVSGPTLGPNPMATVPETPVDGPHTGGNPLIALGSPSPQKNTIPLVRSPILEGGTSPAEGPTSSAPGGLPLSPIDGSSAGNTPVFTPEEGVFSEFDGPLILHGGWRE